MARNRGSSACASGPATSAARSGGSRRPPRIGLAILIVSAVSSALVGRHLTRQIRRLAKAADRLRTLELDQVAPVPDSRFRELSDAARAFNAMLVAMRLFETYLPKSLVLRLLRRADRAVRSEERELHHHVHRHPRVQHPGREDAAL